MAITKRMDQVRQIMKTFLNTYSIKATARRMQVSKNTIRGYVRRGKVHCEDLSQLLLLEDAEFSEVFYPSKDTAAMKRKDVFRGQIDYWIKEPTSKLTPVRSWVDVAIGEVNQNQVLVVVMPHSQYTFANAVASQKVADFIHGLNQALLYFGKLPKVILSDNLKSDVIKSDKYDPTFNDLCVQLAAHYQIDLDATRVRKPKDKANVENMVATKSPF